MHFFVVNTIHQRQFDVKSLILLLNIGQIRQIEFDDMKIDALMILAVLSSEVVLNIAEVGQLDFFVEVEGIIDFLLQIEDAESHEATVAEHYVHLALGMVEGRTETALQNGRVGSLIAEDRAMAAKGIS